MASASKVQVTLHKKPEFYISEIPPESFETATDLLQHNHENNHIFYKFAFGAGFHNHIAHHMLTLWSLGATSSQLQRAFDFNQTYQRSTGEIDESVIAALSDPNTSESVLGNEKHYHSILQFFRDEISHSTWQDVVQKYVFSGTPFANNMLIRQLAGLLHPLIHLGYGIEFEQPAIIAEALAQAAVHDMPHYNDVKKFYVAAEKARAERWLGERSKLICDLMEDIRADVELNAAPKWEDKNHLRAGTINRALERIVVHTSQFSVEPRDLERKTAEMANCVALFTAGAMREDREVKFDFFYMHCLNCAIFFSAFLKQTWLSDANKCLLLEYKVWMDLAIYASKRSPKPDLDRIRTYQPKIPSGWDGIFARTCAHEDDAHLSKLVRVLAHSERICGPYENKSGFNVKKGDWLQIAHMAVDSIEAGAPYWVRGAGFEEAWVEAEVPMKTFG